MGTDNQGLICMKCGFEAKTKAGLKSHERTCKEGLAHLLDEEVKANGLTFNIPVEEAEGEPEIDMSAPVEPIVGDEATALIAQHLVQISEAMGFLTSQQNQIQDRLQNLERGSVGEENLREAAEETERLLAQGPELVRSKQEVFLEKVEAEPKVIVLAQEEPIDLTINGTRCTVPPYTQAAIPESFALALKITLTDKREGAARAAQLAALQGDFSPEAKAAGGSHNLIPSIIKPYKGSMGNIAELLGEASPVGGVFANGNSQGASS